MKKNYLVVATVIAALFFSACGNEELPEPVEPNWYPLSVGNVWEYREETVLGVVDTLRYEVTQIENIVFGYDIGEREVYVLENTFPDSITTESRIQYLYDDGVRIDRLRHIIFSAPEIVKSQREFVPGFLRFDRNQVTVGDSWTETVQRHDTVTGSDSASYLFLIDSITETVELVDGTVLSNCMKMNRTNLGDSEVKTYYFADGIGKVKEITSGGSSDKTELLTQIPAFSMAL